GRAAGGAVEQAAVQALERARAAAGEEDPLDGVERLGAAGLEIEGALEVEDRERVVGAEGGVDAAEVVVRRRVVGVDRQRARQVRGGGVGGAGVAATGQPVGPAERGVVVGLVGRGAGGGGQLGDRLREHLAGEQLLAGAEGELGVERRRALGELAAGQLLGVLAAAGGGGRRGARPPARGGELLRLPH